MKKVKLKDAKAALSALADEAASGESVLIRQDAKKLAPDERLAKAPSFGELLDAFPGAPEDLPERRRPARIVREDGF